MNPSQLHLVVCYLRDRGRIYRSSPSLNLPPAERYSQIERLVESLWSVASALHINLGPRPTCIITGINAIVPHEALARLVAFDVELQATYLMLGIADTQCRAFYETCQHRLGAPTPSYKTIVDEECADEEDPIYND